MSGHSKWNNIKHKKEKTDSQRAKIFTKFGREMQIAIKEGGSADPAANSRLKDIIAKAKANNVPNDNIERILKKAAGEGGASYENIVYEGYGPNGVAVIVETLTDNRNRTAADMRHYFDKYGSALGQTGCVSWQFARKGIIVIDKEDIDEEALMLAAMEAGAADITDEDEVFEIVTATEDLSAVRDALSEAGYTFITAEEQMIPSTYVELTSEEDLKRMGLLLEKLEESDDVQDVWHNCENIED
ncbi:MAG: YebC/PmpR family DNA-binding transcriptional regulator [Ruminococcaceae bacterium]|nr:YebC/PmpR family DNA-binding transcriptional regulator [Oscillospiraceae bacterium]